MELAIPLLALCWGVIWAIVLQTTALGRFLARRRAWLAVVIGVGVDVALLAWVLPLELWLRLVLIIAMSSVGIIARSIGNEFAEHQAQARLLGRGAHAKQAEITDECD